MTRLAPLAFLLLCTTPALAQELAGLEYRSGGSETGHKHLTIDAQGGVTARFRSLGRDWQEVPPHPRAGEAVRGTLTVSEQLALSRAVARTTGLSGRTERDSYVPADRYHFSLSLRLRRPGEDELVERSIGGSTIHPTAVPMLTDAMHLDNERVRRRLQPLFDVLDAIHDRLVPPSYAQASGRLELKGGVFRLVGPTGALRLTPRRGVPASRLKGLVGRPLTVRGYVTRTQPERVMAADTLVSPMFLTTVAGVVQQDVPGAIRLTQAEGLFGDALPDLRLFGSLAELLEGARGRSADLRGYYFAGSAELLVTMLKGQVRRTTRLRNPKGRVARITKGKAVEVHDRFGDADELVRVRTWGWIFTRGTGTLRVDEIEVGGSVSSRRGVWGLSSYVERLPE